MKPLATLGLGIAFTFLSSCGPSKYFVGSETQKATTLPNGYIIEATQPSSTESNMTIFKEGAIFYAALKNPTKPDEEYTGFAKKAHLDEFCTEVDLNKDKILDFKELTEMRYITALLYTFGLMVK